MLRWILAASSPKRKHIRWLSPIRKMFQKIFHMFVRKGFEFAYISFRLSDGNYLNFKCVSEAQHTRYFGILKWNCYFTLIRFSTWNISDISHLRIWRCDKNFPIGEQILYPATIEIIFLFIARFHQNIYSLHLLYPWARIFAFSFLYVGRIQTSSNIIEIHTKESKKKIDREQSRLICISFGETGRNTLHLYMISFSQ